MDVKLIPFLKNPFKDTEEQGRKLGLRDITRDGQTKKKHQVNLGDYLPTPTSSASKKTETDQYESSKKAEDTAADGKSVTQDTNGLKISYQFDLFYELSQKVSAKMGQKGVDRFTEVASKVSETFKGAFSLSVDPIGSYMNGTDKSLDISPETANRFMDSVDKLADLSPEALQNFFKEADTFFGELEKTYGSANGTFDDINKAMQAQAQQFFDGVQGIRQDAIDEASAALSDLGTAALPADTQPSTALTGAVTTGLQSASTVASLLPDSTESSDGLIPLSLSNGTATKEEYQNFLQGFSDYVRKFRAQMLQDFFSSSFARPTSSKKTEVPATTPESTGTKESTDSTNATGTTGTSEVSNAADTSSADEIGGTSQPGSLTDRITTQFYMEKTEIQISQRSRMMNFFTSTPKQNDEEKLSTLNTVV
ncbi:MAG: hypothetical protein WA705_26260 [Candidatus Ozemobacteraceae bacterium]